MPSPVNTMTNLVKLDDVTNLYGIRSVGKTKVIEISVCRAQSPLAILI